MKEMSRLDFEPRYAPASSPEAVEVASAMTETVGDPDMLETLVSELKRAGIWGRLGEITWARDTRDGILIQWVPAH